MSNCGIPFYAYYTKRSNAYHVSKQALRSHDNQGQSSETPPQDTGIFLAMGVLSLRKAD